jgi:hypothetical protein
MGGSALGGVPVYGAGSLCTREDREGTHSPVFSPNRLASEVWIRLNVSPGLAGAKCHYPPLSKGGLLGLDEPEARSFSPRPTADKGRLKHLTPAARTRHAGGPFSQSDRSLWECQDAPQAIQKTPRKVALDHTNQ